jgi:uncharacterized protein
LSERPLIEYPCSWTYAVIGIDEEELRLVIGSTLRGRRHKVTFSRLSRGKKYTAMHIELRVESEEDRDALFQAFQSHPKVKYVL